MSNPEGEIVYYGREPSRLQKFISEAPAIPTRTGRLLWLGYTFGGAYLTDRTVNWVDSIIASEGTFQTFEWAPGAATLVLMMSAFALGTKVVNPVINRIVSVARLS